VYQAYFHLVYAYVARRLRDRSKSEDVTSEVFHKALQNLPRFKWTGAPFGAWLLRIASNVIADRAKRDAREGNRSLNLEDAERGRDLRVDKGVNMPRAGQTQQQDLEKSERRARLFRLVGELAEDQRRVVVLRFGEEKSIREIADDLGRSEGAVKQLQFRALENLRKMLTTEDAEKAQIRVR